MSVDLLTRTASIKMAMDEILEELFISKESDLQHLVPEDSVLKDFFDYDLNAWDAKKVFVKIYEGSWVVGQVNIGDIKKFNESSLKKLESDIFKLVDDYLSEGE